MAEAGTGRDHRAGADPAFDPFRMPGFSEVLSLNPWLTHPAAAMATASVIGFGLASQMTEAFFGAIQHGLQEADAPEAGMAAAPVDKAEAGVATKLDAQSAAATQAEVFRFEKNWVSTDASAGTIGPNKPKRR